ncbi:hypothetical protein Mapa_009681 [Marchantia paleacea]|nr:hypothetical protein Mapa_009681 [Marchantia paleacea]
MYSCRSIVLLLLLSLRQVTLGQGASTLRCHMLPAEECAFAVDSSGKRCVLMEYNDAAVSIVRSCETSDISVGDDSPTEYIETEQCVRACGVQKMTIGFARSTNLPTDQFMLKLCSWECKHNCPNLVDLYNTVAMVVGREGRLNTYTELCGDRLHKSSRLIRFRWPHQML